MSLEKIIMPDHLTGIAWRVACDVQNPLLGPQEPAVYGPQKGASQKGVEQLEKSLTHLSKLLSSSAIKSHTLGGWWCRRWNCSRNGRLFSSSTHFRIWVALRIDWVGTKAQTSRSYFYSPKGKSTNNRYKVKFLWAWHESQKNMAKNALDW